jgi:hypothetical protein
MKDYLLNVARAVPLALGAMLTLGAVVLTLEGENGIVSGVLLGLIGIPLLFASLAHVFADE